MSSATSSSPRRATGPTEGHAHSPCSPRWGVSGQRPAVPSAQWAPACLRLQRKAGESVEEHQNAGTDEHGSRQSDDGWMRSAGYNARSTATAQARRQCLGNDKEDGAAGQRGWSLHGVAAPARGRDRANCLFSRQSPKSLSPKALRNRAETASGRVSAMPFRGLCISRRAGSTGWARLGPQPASFCMGGLQRICLFPGQG